MQQRASIAFHHSSVQNSQPDINSGSKPPSNRFSFFSKTDPSDKKIEKSFNSKPRFQKELSNVTRDSQPQITPFVQVDRKQSSNSTNEFASPSKNPLANLPVSKTRSRSGSDGEAAESTGVKSTFTVSTFSPAAPLSLLLPKGREQYVTMPEIPDDCKVHVQALRCFQMKDAEIEPLYREKLKSKDKTTDEVIARQKELITRLQTGLCCLHMNKKRFVQECNGVEEKYMAMLRQAYSLLRDANRELHIAQNKLHMMEMNILMQSNGLRRRGSATNADPGKPLSAGPSGSDAIAMLRLESEETSPKADASDLLLDPKLVSDPNSIQQNSGPQNTAVYQTAVDEEIADLEAQLSRAQGLAALLARLQAQLLTESGPESAINGSAKTAQEKTVSPLAAARLFSLQKYTKSLFLDVSASAKLSVCVSNKLADN